jgi:hypothetical protein
VLSLCATLVATFEEIVRRHEVFLAARDGERASSW